MATRTGMKSTRGFTPSRSQAACSAASSSPARQSATAASASRAARSDAGARSSARTRSHAAGVGLGRPEQESRQPLELRQHAHLLVHERRGLRHPVGLGAASADPLCSRYACSAAVKSATGERPQVLAVQPLELLRVEHARALRFTRSSVNRSTSSARVMKVVWSS